MALTFRRGIHPNDKKQFTADIPLSEMPAPDKLYISLCQHIGAPCEAIVSKGDTVKVGSLIGQVKGYVSANIYSSVSGEVLGVVNIKNPQGKMVPHVEILNDHKYVEIRLEPVMRLTKENIINRIQESGIAGMGGAAFPTHVKLCPNKPVDLLIINGAECEPYITCDYRLMVEKPDDIIDGVKYAMTALGVQGAVIGIENNKPKAIELLQGKSQGGISVEALKTKYPQGAEKQLIYAISRRKVPMCGLPMDVGVVVVNIHTIYAIAQAVKYGIPSYMRAMTVSGKAIDKPCNLWVRYGVTYQDIYDYTKGDTTEVAHKVLSGGPMMGFAQADLSPTVCKGTSALLFLTDEELNLSEPSACINCCACRDICPMNLMPMFLDSYTLAGDLEMVKRYQVLNCIECGSCSYICPAKRPLVQSIRLAKKQINEKGI